MMCDSNDVTSFPHKSLLRSSQVSKLCKTLQIKLREALQIIHQIIENYQEFSCLK